MRLGRTDGRCPSCKSLLDRPPRRKAACPHCKEIIYVRTRPDRIRVLANEPQKRLIDEAWDRHRTENQAKSSTPPPPYFAAPTRLEGNVVALPGTTPFPTGILSQADARDIHAELLRIADFFQRLGMRGLLKSWSIMNADECYRMADTFKDVAEGKISPDTFIRFGPFHTYLPTDL
jgi:hypothetical protein